jgi:hypothetical protein
VIRRRPTIICRTVRHLIILCAVAACSACQGIPTIDEWASPLIGMPVEHLRALDRRPESRASRIGWVEKTYPLRNGNWAYVQPTADRCELHFEVNPDGIIVGYRPMGEGCRYR